MSSTLFLAKALPTNVFSYNAVMAEIRTHRPSIHCKTSVVLIKMRYKNLSIAACEIVFYYLLIHHNTVYKYKYEK